MKKMKKLMLLIMASLLFLMQPVLTSVNNKYVQDYHNNSVKVEAAAGLCHAGRPFPHDPVLYSAGYRPGSVSFVAADERPGVDAAQPQHLPAGQPARRPFDCPTFDTGDAFYGYGVHLGTQSAL